jgi:hypothetical protein
MFKKIVLLALCISLAVTAPLFSKQGRHIGENKMLDVDIIFSGSSGTTITDATGVYYKYWGYMFRENKVYPQEYWGEYPLYFVGQPVSIMVNITNKGPRAKSKIRIKTEAYTLLTDGSSGMELAEPTMIDVEVEKGETQHIDASFTIQYSPDLDSGLDRFIVKVMHMNEGGGKGNPEPALIMSKEGVFCPPKYKKEK